MTSTNVPYTFLLTNGLSVLDGAKNGIEKLTIPELGDWVDAYDVYGAWACWLIKTNIKPSSLKWA